METIAVVLSVNPDQIEAFEAGFLKVGRGISV